MRVYYHDAQIRVDSWAVSVYGWPYPLCDVESAGRVARHVAGRRAANAGLLLGTVMVAQLLVGLLGWWVVGASGMVITAAVVVLVRGMVGLVTGATALHAVEDIRRFGRRLELWASISGVPVLLLSTDDAIRFGQVCRALARALENRVQDRVSNATSAAVIRAGPKVTSRPRRLAQRDPSRCGHGLRGGTMCPWPAARGGVDPARTVRVQPGQ